MQPIVVTSLVGFVFAAGGVLLVAFGLRFASATEDASRLREYVLEETVGPAAYAPRLAFRQVELAGSIRTRLFVPIFRRLGRIFGGLTPRRLVDDLQRQLAMAGSPLGLGPREFYGLRMISILVGLGVAFMLLRGLAPQSRPAAPLQPGAVTRQAIEMGRRPVALVDVESVAGIADVVVVHKPVPNDLGDDRRGRDEVTEPVASDDRPLKQGEARQRNRVD